MIFLLTFQLALLCIALPSPINGIRPAVISQSTGIEKASSSVNENELKSVVCPGGQSECPDGNTCCIQASGQYGCCPLPNAVCCSDNIHCCPNGYTCDVTMGTCSRMLTEPWMEKSEAASIVPPHGGKNLLCPDHHSQCRDGETCCMLSSGVYGCCPRPNAMCCSDGEHCCPNNYYCNLENGTCSKWSSISQTQLQLTASIATIGNVICPDGASECPDGNTCCKLSSGQWGCCPVPNAVCCKDGQHCCPHGYTCGGGGFCTKMFSIPWLKKTASIATVGSVICPDGASECPNGNTCCKLSSGQYGCCPVPNAVCCKDGQHCCPQGYTCGGGGFCTKMLSMPWLKKTASIATIGSVICPDGASECPNGNTCCKLSSGQYGCCPVPNAVCCKDRQHCCPQGYTCSGGGFCTKMLSIPWLKKTGAVNKLNRMVESLRLVPAQNKLSEEKSYFEATKEKKDESLI